MTKLIRITGITVHFKFGFAKLQKKSFEQMKEVRNIFLTEISTLWIGFN